MCRLIQCFFFIPTPQKQSSGSCINHIFAFPLRHIDLLADVYNVRKKYYIYLSTSAPFLTFMYKKLDAGHIQGFILTSTQCYMSEYTLHCCRHWSFAQIMLSVIWCKKFQLQNFPFLAAGSSECGCFGNCYQWLQDRHC